MPAMFNKTDAEKRARGEILRLNEMDDPPTPDQMRLFLSDPEIDFTPTELVKWLRELKTRMQGNHRHCAGCPLCSDLWVLEHNADYLELACIVIDSAADLSAQLVLALAEVERQANVIERVRDRIEGDDLNAMHSGWAIQDLLAASTEQESRTDDH